MSDKITPKNLKTLIKLLSDYQRDTLHSPDEYLQHIFDKDEERIPVYVAEMFLKYKKHEQIFECLFEQFCTTFKIQNKDKMLVEILLYIIVFELTEDTFENICKIFKKQKKTLCLNLTEFITSEDFLLILTDVTSSIFDSEYTIINIVRPLVSRGNLLENLNQVCESYFKSKERVIPKPTTQAMSPRFTKVTRRKNTFRLVGTPAREPVLATFTRKPCPQSTYCEDEIIKRKLAEAQEKNKTEAMKLLEQARKQAFSCAQVKEKSKIILEEPKKLLKPRKLPKFKPVNVKNNATVLMREAALAAKSYEKETRRLEDMTNGSFDPKGYEALEAEERKRTEQENLQNIQKKHLQGLLTYEEALLAKQNLIELNKKKITDIKLEKEELYRKLDEWKRDEQMKMKALVEKSQNIEKAAREAEKKKVEEKHKFARSVEQETRQLLDKALVEKEAELNRKIDIIKELKTLQSFKFLHQKEFDPTETCNLGLLCEMSILELQERLYLLKLEVEEELEKKRMAVYAKRKQRQEMIKNAEQFVLQNRNNKEKTKKQEVKLEETPEIISLKNRIEEVRKLRLNAVK